MSRSITILSAPTNLGLLPPAADEEPGVNRMPVALKILGLVSDLNAIDRGTVPPLAYSPSIDPETGVRNAANIRSYSERLAGSVKDLVAEDTFLLVLGGDCSILLGAMLGLRRKGKYGLVFIDGHRDFQNPEISATGGAAGMDLALATGRGPESLTHFDDFDSLVEDDAVVVVGFRDEDADARDEGRALDETEIYQIDLDSCRKAGADQVVEQIFEALGLTQLDGFWIHLDVDVLDSDIMPCVDSSTPGGMSYEELAALLLPLVQDSRAVGMEVTIYDPARDPGGVVGQALVAWLVDLFEMAGFLRKQVSETLEDDR